jgi:ATP-dependent Lon protease
LEHLAVLKLRGDMKAPIICLFGPPGVGKTSLGKSVAKALKREYVRVSLGGLHDEAEIRGHRRTYVGAMPGRIINGILKSGADNPVFVLDEIDKIGSDFKGDPSSALLEVLDPEQNANFHDNYLDVDYDLSKVLFIATANSLSTIAAPLLDRMEIIDLSGYIMEEKIEIGLRHLLPRQLKEHGLDDVKFSIPRKTMEQIIDRYTRESGVRLLEKRLAKIMRKVAWKVANGDECPSRLRPEDLSEYLGMPDYDPDKYEGNDYAGVVTGLAWTSVGGEILYVESALCKGKGEKLMLTGNLGDVMKESAMLALQYVKSNADLLQIPENVFDNYTVHIHCPEGAIPKDGPSAGITMVTSLASTFTQRKVRAHLAMTGEITLRGRVLPVGGIKEKILAAKRAGITDIVLCIDNKKDIEDIKAEYIAGLTFHYVRDISEVLEFALLPDRVKNAKTF